MRLALALVALPVLLGQQPARDPGALAPRPTGTASISGRVVTDDGNAEPIRKVRVVLSSADGTLTRIDVTEDSGAFVFRDLPAGRFTLSAFKSPWLPTKFGATRQGRPGTPMVVADGARLNGITLRMAHGAVITGVVRDVTGQPAAGVRMQVSRLLMRNGERYLEGLLGDNGGPIETDDTGTYRIFGLPPGDVIVAAAAQPRSSTFSDGDGVFRFMSGPPMKMAIVFYPGTTDPNSAAVITLGAGEERAGIDLTMQPFPASRIEGVVTDAAGAPQSRMPVLAVFGGLQLGNLMGMNGTLAASTDSNGHYELIGLTPAEYTIMSSGRDQTWAETRVTVSSGQDLNLPLTLQPYLTISGRIVFEGAPAPTVQSLSYTLASNGNYASLMALATVGRVPLDSLTFENQVIPGAYQLQFTGIPAGWYPKSAMARGQDTLDLPVEIRPGDRLTEFVATFTDTPSELTGSLVDATGRPASEYFVVVFSTDRKFWTQPSRRVVQVRPGNDGTFSVKALPAGDYFIAALTDIEPGESLTAEFLESMMASAPPVRVKIVDGQKTTQGLRVGGKYW